MSQSHQSRCATIHNEPKSEQAERRETTKSGQFTLEKDIRVFHRNLVNLFSKNSLLDARRLKSGARKPEWLLEFSSRNHLGSRICPNSEWQIGPQSADVEVPV